MSIYTRTGDSGETGLIGNRRVRKNDLRIEAYGSVDELNAHLGSVRAGGLPEELDASLGDVQATLFDVGADLATVGGRTSVSRVVHATAKLESWIDALEKHLPTLRTFILPGGHAEAASFHVARTVCRRAERAVWALSAKEEVPDELGVFLNRLSDALFVLARDANRRHGVDDVPWRADSDSGS